VTGPRLLARDVLRRATPVVQACVGPVVTIGGARVTVPGPLTVRLSVAAGNIRVQRLMDRALRPGATVIDVGAHTGYNVVYAAERVGRAGRVVAIEPARDNLALLRENVGRNGLDNVVVHEVAAGRARGTHDFYVRGGHSAVNSLFADSVYASVTAVESTTVAPVDDLVDGDADLVKIDVEGAELDVLAGMTRLLRSPGIRLIVEWHPALQEMAGYPADALPRFLLNQGFTLTAASHTRMRPFGPADIAGAAHRLRAAGRPIELFAERPTVSRSD
jgi:FkbM family methyltransferase